MGSNQQFSVTLSNELADVVRAKVASGEYASADEVFQDSLQLLMAQNAQPGAMDRWLMQQVLPAYDAVKADPQRALDLETVRANLAAEHQTALRQGR